MCQSFESSGFLGRTRMTFVDLSMVWYSLKLNEQQSLCGFEGARSAAQQMMAIPGGRALHGRFNSSLSVVLLGN